MRVLVSGTHSGLGRYLCEHFEADRFDRGAVDTIFAESAPYDLIIHCAFNAAGHADLKAAQQYFADNCELTRRLLEIPCRLFVLASTIDLYQRFPQANENTILTLDQLIGGYPVAKFLSESHVVNSGVPFLILRLAMPVGPYSRPNNLIRVLNGATQPLSLTANSLYNLVDVRSIARFIEAAHARKEQGIFNVGSRQRASLARLAELAGTRPCWGHHRYTASTFRTEKASAVLGDFSQSTLQVAKRLLEDGFLPELQA